MQTSPGSPEILNPTAKTRDRCKTPIPESADVVIVGAGPGGLTAGAYLAQHGLKVAIFDHHYVAGGCATMFTRGTKAERYAFDVGLHYIGDCGPEGRIPTILRDLGLGLDFRELDPDGFDTLVFPDLEFKIPSDMGLYRDRLVSLFPKEKRGIDRYMRLVREVWHMGQQSTLRGDKMSSPGMIWQALTRGRLVARNQNSTIGAFLDSCTQDPRLRAILLGQSGDYGLPPSKVSALLHCGLAAHYFAGAYYPQGGGQAISDQLADTIEAHGGSIVLRCGIDKILVENGRMAGVRTAKVRGAHHEVRAPVVISNADIRLTLEQLIGPEHLPSSLVQRSENFEMAAAIFMAFLGVRGDMRERGMRNCNYWVFDDYDMEELYAKVARGETNPRCAYITSASLKDLGTGGHAPSGVTSVEVMTVLPGQASAWGVSPEELKSGRYRQDGAYLEKKHRVEEALIETLDRVFPGSAADVCFRESASPVTHSRYTRATDGTGYGIAATPEQFMGNRPGYRLPIEGGYLAGASTRSGHGIVGAMISGVNAAKRVARDLGRPLESDSR